MALGNEAMLSRSGGSYAVAVGYKSMANSNDSYTCALGALAGSIDDFGSYAAAIGKGALYDADSTFAVGIGVEAAYSFDNSYLMAIGNSAFRSQTSGGYLTAVGHNAGINVGNLIGVTIIGNDAATSTAALGTTIIGNSNQLPGGAGNYTTDIADLLYTGSAKVGINQPDMVRELNISDVMRLEPRSSAPSSPVLGDLYVDLDTDELCFYDGSSWYGIRASQTCS